jgi:DNA-binding response OmpR family regulator
MNFVKKILLVHGDEKIRRTLTLLLAGAGYDIRPCGPSEAALDAARGEWFDLALVADSRPAVSPVDFINALRKLQPRVPVLLLVDQLELPSVIEGIRLAVTDVLAPGGDLMPVVQRVNALLRPGEAPVSGDLTPEELAEVESILAKFADGTADPFPAPDEPPPPPDALREQLQRLTRERDDFQKTAERLAREKSALEAELKAPPAQPADTARLESELAALREEREVVAVGQAAIDEKARALAAAREELSRERAALAAERASPPPPAEDAERREVLDQLAHERGLLDDLRLELRAEDARLREAAARLREGESALTAERQRFEEDMQLLRDEEANLRAYELRLRNQPVEAAAETASGPRSGPRPSREPFQRDPSLDEAWDKLNRGMDMLEAERRNFTDEKLVLKEEKARMQEWATRLETLEAALTERERQLNAPPPPRPSFTHAPFKAAKAMLAGNKK